MSHIKISRGSELLSFLADCQGMSEKRAERRIPVLARVEALWEDETRTPRVAPATIEDKSRSGVSIRINNPISVGSKLTIKWHREQFSGTVTNSRQDKTAYILGIRRDVPPTPEPKKRTT